MSAASGARKDLAATAAATAFQRTYVGELRRRVIERGEPFVVAQADTPHEIFHVMDIALITNQWWSAYLAAKQLSAPYFEALERQGYPSNSCRYCTLGLACTLAADPATAPWGGLPRPTALVARLTCDCIQHVFALWARALGTDFFALEAPAWIHKDPAWFEHSRERWMEVYEPERIELMVQEMRELIGLLERKTDRRFDESRLATLMERINEQEGYIAEASELIGATRPCPVAITDQMPNTMIPQWHRGSDWALAHARRFRDEVIERVRAGSAVCADERLRLMWIGAGLWHDAGFYNTLEEQCGAVFVWSMYMPFAKPQYLREVQGRPLHALASRICSMNEVLHLPPWMGSWMVSEAQRCAIDAAVILMPPSNRLSQSGVRLTARALEAAGVPTLTVQADMVASSGWDRARFVAHVTKFLSGAGLI
jgi:benzoyl-CoA reductase subunit B